MRFLIVFLTVLTLITLSPADAKAGLPDSLMQHSDMPAATPWLAAVLLPHGLACSTKEDIGWFGDFERSLAWALVETARERKEQDLRDAMGF